MNSTLLYKIDRLDLALDGADGNFNLERLYLWQLVLVSQTGQKWKNYSTKLEMKRNGEICIWFLLFLPTFVSEAFWMKCRNNVQWMTALDIKNWRMFRICLNNAGKSRTGSNNGYRSAVLISCIQCTINYILMSGRGKTVFARPFLVLIVIKSVPARIGSSFLQLTKVVN